MTVKDLIEDWIAMRSTLTRQLSALKSGQLTAGTAAESAPAATIARLQNLIGELNGLLKEYSVVDRA